MAEPKRQPSTLSSPTTPAESAPPESKEPAVYQHPSANREEPPRPQLDRNFFVRAGVNAAAFLLAGLLLIVLLGMLQRMGWIGAAASATATQQTAPGGAIYTCPMHPQIRQPKPGRCPICSMPLVLAKTGDEGAQDANAVTVEPAARRLANIQTAPVEKRPVEKPIESIGRIAIDESRLATISAYVAGRIERLFADYTGVAVAQGDHLVVIYSPQLYAAQVEYLESGRTLAAMAAATLPAVHRSQKQLVESSRQRLSELGMTNEQLAELDQSQEPRSRITTYAPIGGTVIEKLVVEGQYVEVGEPIYRIADLSTVWLVLQLFPEDAALVRFGQRVDVEVQSLPGQMLEGRVAFVNPVVDDKTRTVDVRVEMLNDRRLLRPGDYARAQVIVPLGEKGQVYDADLAGKWISPMHPQIIRDEPGQCPICGMDLISTSEYGYADTPVPQPEVLVVPRRAVLMTGSTSLVYVETEAGRFEIRPVKLGPLLRDEAVILEGVSAGEQVAVSGNFLIDSQMQLAGKPSLIDPTRAVAAKAEAGEPLSIPADKAQPIPSDAGRNLERLYASYFTLVASLAADRVPSEVEVVAVEQAAAHLAESESLGPPLREHSTAIAKGVAHLHHRSLEEAREQFKAISRHILLLVAVARGEEANKPVFHYYCAMVPGGGGDWLQADEPPTNPYWGSKMLRCAQHQEQLQPPQSQASAIERTRGS
ncbi:MAG: efflux RND transporter periplasmic adaptor subunit [Pirellulales bacterium]